MVETIQSFVDKIRNEGVEAGQKQADDLLAQAKSQAEEILNQAQQQKQQILEKAEQDAQTALARAQTEMELACRDSALRLRDALSRAISQVLTSAVREKLSDAGFLAKLLSDIVLQYAQADIDDRQAFQINVPEETYHVLADWALSEIAHDTADGVHTSIDLNGTLRQAGFEYNAKGANIEVTLESVVAVLSEMVSPRLREMLDTSISKSGSREETQGA